MLDIHLPAISNKNKGTLIRSLFHLTTLIIAVRPKVFLINELPTF